MIGVDDELPRRRPIWALSKRTRMPWCLVAGGWTLSVQTCQHSEINHVVRNPQLAVDIVPVLTI